jgi:hypothetical protein
MTQDIDHHDSSVSLTHANERSSRISLNTGKLDRPLESIKVSPNTAEIIRNENSDAFEMGMSEKSSSIFRGMLHEVLYIIVVTAAQLITVRTVSVFSFGNDVAKIYITSSKQTSETPSCRRRWWQKAWELQIK